MTEYTQDELEILKALFASPGWGVFIRPFKEHVGQMTRMISEDEDMAEEQRKSMIRVRKVYKEIIDSPMKVFESSPGEHKFPNFDPYD